MRDTTTSAHIEAEHGETSRALWPMLASLTILAFAILLGDTALSVALPALRDELDVGFSGLQWIINSYALASAAVLLPAGKLVDLVGNRIVLAAGLVLFVVASLVAGLSPSLEMLMIGRILQGVGGGLMAPAMLACIISGYPPQRLTMAIGIWVGGSTTALALGPLVGGLVIEALDWHWLFFLNVALLVLWLPIRSAIAPGHPRWRELRHFDVLGSLMVAGGLVALVYGLQRAATEGLISGGSLPAAVGGAALLVVFGLYERRRRKPLLDMSLLRQPGLAAANTLALLSAALMCGVFFFLAIYMQGVLGYSALRAGLLLLPITTPLVVLAPVAASLVRRRGGRFTMGAGFLLLSVFLAVLGVAVNREAVWLLLTASVGAGTGMTLSATPASAMAVEGIPRALAGAGSGLLNTSRTVGIAIGVTLMAALIAGHDLPGQLPSSGESFSHGLYRGLLASAGLAAGAFVFSLVALPKRKPNRAAR